MTYTDSTDSTTPTGGTTTNLSRRAVVGSAESDSTPVPRHPVVVMSSTHGVEDAEESVDVPEPGAVGLGAYPREGNPGKVGGGGKALWEVEGVYIVVAGPEPQLRSEGASRPVRGERSAAAKSEYSSREGRATGQHFHRTPADTEVASYGPDNEVVGSTREDLAESSIREASIESRAGETYSRELSVGPPQGGISVENLRDEPESGHAPPA